MLDATSLFTLSGSLISWGCGRSGDLLALKLINQLDRPTGPFTGYNYEIGLRSVAHTNDGPTGSIFGCVSALIHALL